jgi:hypothetical protein
VSDSLFPRGANAPAATVDGARRGNTRPSERPFYRRLGREVKTDTFKPVAFFDAGREGGSMTEWFSTSSPEERRRRKSGMPRTFNRGDDPGRLITLPLGLITDRALIPTDVIVSLAIVVTIPEGSRLSRARNEEILTYCRLKQRALHESLVRLQDAGWFAVQRGKPRIIMPLWLPQDEEGGDR